LHRAWCGFGREGAADLLAAADELDQLATG
jgi:hypothetical protein